MRAIHFDEAARWIEHTRALIDALSTDQSRMQTARLHPAHSLDSHGPRVSSSGEVRSTSDRLEMPDSIRRFQPSDAVAEKFAGGVFEHDVEFRVVQRR